MSWETPKTLAEFDAQSPFFGLPASKDVSVLRQVLAEPEVGLASPAGRADLAELLAQCERAATATQKVVW